MKKGRIGVLVSGAGTNLQAILDACKNPTYPAEIKIVISNIPTAYALERAKKEKIPALVVPHEKYPSRKDFEMEIVRHLERTGVDLIVLAGFMRILSTDFIRHFENKIINIHPSLLPSFPGTHAIEKAWEYGVKVTGVTVHFVDEGTDTGPIILQETVGIKEGESLKSLEERIHAMEHQLYPEAIKLFAQNKLEIRGRKVLQGGSSL